MEGGNCANFQKRKCWEIFLVPFYPPYFFLRIFWNVSCRTVDNKWRQRKAGMSNEPLSRVMELQKEFFPQSPHTAPL